MTKSNSKPKSARAPKSEVAAALDLGLGLSVNKPAQNSATTDIYHRSFTPEPPFCSLPKFPESLRPVLTAWWATLETPPGAASREFPKMLLEAVQPWLGKRLRTMPADLREIVVELLHPQPWAGLAPGQRRAWFENFALAEPDAEEEFRRHFRAAEETPIDSDALVADLDNEKRLYDNLKSMTPASPESDSQMRDGLKHRESRVLKAARAAHSHQAEELARLKAMDTAGWDDRKVAAYQSILHNLSEAVAKLSTRIEEAGGGPLPAAAPGETRAERQDRRLAACEAAGLVMPESEHGHLPAGVGAQAKREGVTRQSYSEDLKDAITRRAEAKRAGQPLTVRRHSS